MTPVQTQIATPHSSPTTSRTVTIVLVILATVAMLVASATDGFASNCNLYADAPTVNSDGVQIDARSRAYCPSNPGTHTLKSTLVRVLSWMPDSNIKSAYDSVPNSAGDYFATATGCYWGGYTSTWKTVGNITGNGSATSATRQYYCP